MNTTKKLTILLMAVLALTSCGSDEKDVKETRVMSGDLMAPYFLYDMEQAGYFWTFSGNEAAYAIDVSTMISFMSVRCIAFYSSWDIENGELVLDGSERHQVSRLEPKGGHTIRIDDAEYLPSNNAKHGSSIDQYLIQTGFTKQMLMDALRESYETGNIVDIEIRY